jgi:hypothetical protein
MRERADELKGQVRRMFVTGGKDMSIADMLSLVDTLKRLGIDNHFHEEIDLALSHIHTEDQDNFHGSNDLHVVALRFGLLRQHGLWVSAGNSPYRLTCIFMYHVLVCFVAYVSITKTRDSSVFR